MQFLSFFIFSLLISVGLLRINAYKNIGVVLINNQGVAYMENSLSFISNLPQTSKQSIFSILTHHQSEDIFIVDTLNALCRYSYANQYLSVQHGDVVELTGHIHGFINMVQTLKSRFHNCPIILTVDGHAQFRYDIIPEYKGQRNHSITAAVRKDVDVIVSLLSLYDGIYICAPEDYEADDAISVISKTLRTICKEKKFHRRIHIISNDKDLLQCVRSDSPCTVDVIRKLGSLTQQRIVSAHREGSAGADVKDLVVSQKDIEYYFPGVPVENLCLYRSILGDKSDNLPGYYRFFSSHAAYIASHTFIDPNTYQLIPVHDSEFGTDKTLAKALKRLNDEPLTWQKNYKVMSLRNFDFSLYPVCTSTAAALATLTPEGNYCNFDIKEISLLYAYYGLKSVAATLYYSPSIYCRAGVIKPMLEAMKPFMEG